ncbi:MAG: NAD+ synthase [Elusimicrobiota bacterium]
MKITFAQLNTRVGDIDSNISKAIEAYKKAESENSDIIIYPELFTTGYPPLDLLENKHFIEKNIKALKSFAATTNKAAAVIGFVDFNHGYGKKLFNSAAFIYGGKIQQILKKNLLPTYDVFDEKRYFSEGTQNKIIKFKNKKILITICEDIWGKTDLLPDKNLYSKDTMSKYSPDIIINLSASPYYFGKITLREKILCELAKDKKADIAYVNLVGANDDLVFDGSSMLISKKGKIFQLQPFTEQINTVDLSRFLERKYTENISFLKQAIVVGIKDFFKKQNLKSAIIGLSGGIDSAVVASLCVEAIGNENVLGILMPSEFTSKQSIEDAIKLSKKLGIRYKIIPIKNIYRQYLKELSLTNQEIDITLQNIQSRIRGDILMSYSNKEGGIVIATSNKSEIAMGYFTLYGDSCGAIAPIGDVLKTQVYEVAEEINKDKEIIPDSIIKRPPTAELKPNQLDQDDLPPYKILDKIIKLYIEEELSLDKIQKILKNKINIKDIIYRIELNEYKRKQIPISIKVSKKAFGSGRKIPIVRKILYYE